MKYVIRFDQIIDLDVKPNQKREEIIQDYINKMGGPQVILNNFFRNINFTKENIIKEVKEIKDIKKDDVRESLQKTSN